MTDAKKKPERKPGEDTVSNKVFWPVAIGILVLIVVAVVATVRYVRDDDAELTQQLNDRYVEKIELTSTSSGNGGVRTILKIDGQLRYDCSERDAVITCDDDPQPTEE